MTQANCPTHNNGPVLGKGACPFTVYKLCLPPGLTLPLPPAATSSSQAAETITSPGQSFMPSASPRVTWLPHSPLHYLDFYDHISVKQKTLKVKVPC